MTTPLQDLIRDLARKQGISEEFMSAASHQYSCTCKSCYEYWEKMGKDPDSNSYGPFGDNLYNSYEEWQDERNS